MIYRVQCSGRITTITASIGGRHRAYVFFHTPVNVFLATDQYILGLSKEMNRETMNDSSQVDWPALVQQAMVDELGAFEVMYRNTVRQVLATVRVLVSHQSEAEEIVQEVYVNLWRSLPRFDASRPFLPWLQGLVVRQVRRASRSRWHRWRTHERAAEMWRDGEAGGLILSESSADRLALRMDLMDSLASLPLPLREVVVLRYVHGYQLAEIAEIVGIPEGTARSRHHSALKKLRIELSDTEGGASVCLPSET